MTKRRRRKAARGKPAPQAPPLRFRDQARCETCGRFRLRAEACWFCHPAWPDPCICDVVVPVGTRALGRHVHLDHALLEHLSQMDYESIDETILLPTDQWPASDDDEVNFLDEERVGIDEVAVAPQRFRRAHRQWRDQPEYKAFLALHPDLRTRARLGIDSIYRFFDLTESEADAWSLEAAGYTREAIAVRLRFRPGGVEQLLAAVQSKITARLKQSARAFLRSAASSNRGALEYKPPVGVVVSK